MWCVFSRSGDLFFMYFNPKRNGKLINKIDRALKKLRDGTYGYCEDTGEAIGLKRLIARPIATLCIEAQEKHEKEEKEKKTPECPKG